jgi:ferritin-like metal-binding protein YciE
MDRSEQKIVQYLNEAHATEVGLAQVLRSQIAMTPRGSYRTGLEKHLRETEAHAQRVQARLGELAAAGNPLLAGIGLMESALAQTLALWKTPLDLLRGDSAEEKVLKNAKDACATEALEIATYTALEHLADAVGDQATAELAASIRADEERMLALVVGELPKLAQAVTRSSSAVAGTGAADAVRGDEPWPGYDGLTVDEIRAALGAGVDDERASAVRRYERAHKKRAGVLNAVERELVTS